MGHVALPSCELYLTWCNEAIGCFRFAYDRLGHSALLDTVSKQTGDGPEFSIAVAL